MNLSNQLLLAPILGALIGLALGMLGGGGSILTVPILVYLLGLDAHIAVATSLVIVGINAVAGAGMHLRERHVRLKQALFFGAYGIPAAFVGARLSRFLSGPTLLVLFAVLMLVVAALMLRRSAPPAWQGSATSGWRVVLGGLSVGFLTGFLGVGGGFLIVPALVLLLGMEMPEAVGSSLVVIALNSVAGLLGHLDNSALPWTLIGIFAISGLVGLRVSSWTTHWIPPGRLRQSFALFVVALALVLLAINLPAVVTAYAAA